MLGEFDALVLSSLSEGLSISILEGMAAGLPLVATDVGGNGRLVKDGVTGLLVPSEDEDAMATALLSIAGDRTLARRYGVAGYEVAKAEFSTAHMTREYEKLYAAV
jgi:glycosyltransferase involved in cell wall biosynthesis